MNKILTTIPGNFSGCQNIDILDPSAWCYMVKSIEKNGTFVPGIKRVLFNTGNKKYMVRDADGKTVKDENGKVKTEIRKVLTTVIFFDDGTKCTVTNSEHDGVQFEKNEDGIEVASRCSKECGIVYCILKRCCADIDATGTALGTGFGRRLNDIVDAAYDSKVEEAKRKAAKAAAKAKYEAIKGTAKPKRQRESLAKTIDRLTDILEALQDKIQK